jgi:hypothetical protein
MKNWALDGKICDLEEKMKEERHERVAVLDFERTFTEGEKALINNMREILEKFEVTGSTDLIVENLHVVLKFDQIMLNYAMYTLREVLLYQFGNLDSEIDQWYFNLHFYNFYLDLHDVLDRVHNWPREEKEALEKELKENDLKDRVFRIPRDSCGELIRFSKQC